MVGILWMWSTQFAKVGYSRFKPNLQFFRNQFRKQCYDPICFDTFEDHSDCILEDSPPFFSVDEIEALRNDLANMLLQPALDDLDQLNLEDDQEDVADNNETMDNEIQNEDNRAPYLSDEKRNVDFEITHWA
ncbi:hypothetical protein PIB30_018507 [Stylosanthes scabra]|uniref:Uncharacterized protein n=1 Tax=Stylosanthes scabra TaxID=79078 RepID=A0ABU6X9I4_9FABA|nr:hypothetical protein [Stylosanthes scabra]